MHYKNYSFIQVNLHYLSYNGPAFPTSPSPKVMAEPYIALMLGSGEPGPAGLGLGDVARQAPNMSSHLAGFSR